MLHCPLSGCVCERAPDCLQKGMATLTIPVGLTIGNNLDDMMYGTLWCKAPLLSKSRDSSGDSTAELMAEQQQLTYSAELKR